MSCYCTPLVERKSKQYHSTASPKNLYGKPKYQVKRTAMAQRKPAAGRVISQFVARQTITVYRYQVTALKRFAFRAALFSTVILTVAYVSLFFFVRSARFQQWLKSEATHRTGYEIDLVDLRLAFPFKVVASGLTVSDESGLLLQAQRVTVTLAFVDLLSKGIYRLQLQKPVFHVDLQKLFDSSAKAALDIAIRHLNVEDGTVVLKTIDEQSLEFHAVNLNAQNVNMGQMSGIVLRTDLPWLKGSAEISVHSGHEQQEAEIKVRQAPAKNLPGLLSSQTPPHDALNVKIKLQKTNSQALAVSASGLVDKMAIGTEKISGRFESRADIDPSFKNAALSVNIEATALPSQIGSVKLPAIPGGAVGTLEGSYSFPEKTMTFKSFQLTSASGTADAKGVIVFNPEPTVAKAQANLRKIPVEAIKSLLPEPIRAWTVRGSADADLAIEGPWRAIAISGVARTNGAELKSDAFSLQQLNLTAPFAWANSTLRAGDVRIQGKTLALTGGPAKFAAEELQLDGALEVKPNQPLKANGKLRLLRGRYATSDGSKMGENFTLAGHFDITTREKKNISLSGNLNIEEGELLWGKFFGDFKSQKPSLDFDGDYLASQDELQLRRLDLSLANIGKIGLSGTLQQISEKPIARIQVNGNDIQPSGAFDFFIRDTLSRSYPILDQLNFDGRIDLAAKVSGALTDLFVEGNLQVRRGGLGVKSDKWQVGPMNLALPFRLHWPAATREGISASVPTGTLAVESFRFGSEIVPALKTTVSLWNNALRFNQPIRLAVYGGTIEIRNLAWADLIRYPQAFSLSIETKDLQLQKLTEAWGWYRFGGTLSGSIPKVEMTGNVLRSEGQIQIEVFGGHVQLSKTEIENPFSSLPAIKLDTRFQGIHLEQASETFAFGHISGILEGTISDLIISNGQPSQMRAEIQTVARSGSSQWISVEALNKITVLSSGQNGSLIYGGIAGFFDEFRYSKMGFKATLRNDKLTLRGIESSDGKEFLVVGSFLPPTVNVISHTQEIGFGDLMKRLEQIQKSDNPQIK
jgi:hypothetical protein